ncbi:MICOS complex subunit MIC25 isoform X2 [Trachypithecus francoisi]|uniref:MICOS complex subunit MIC25 isoform X2 n=1 Tax=Trachypithecus francoisi TaxID=54180 RepID=UPI00141BEB4A|nr:MICOS complex subunit MIC25 isoform X2 [Trachypithecus francoisi]
MGSTESSEGRRVSFGVDEEERVRVLQGVRLSENVVNRMKEPSSAPPAPAPSTFGLQDGNLKAPHKESTLPRSGSSGGQQISGAKEDVKRYEQKHAAVQDKLFQVAKREREAATKHSKASLPMGEDSISHEEQKSVRLQARELESREAELRRRDTFYKEQLGRIERKSAEMYKLSSQQFHEAASKMESTINIRCSRLILSFLCPSPGVSRCSQEPHSFCWRMLLETTLWGLSSGCAPCYGGVIASRCSQGEELGNMGPAVWSPSAQGCRPRSSTATEIARMRCCCAQTWSRHTNAA